MITQAIFDIGDKKGASRDAIWKYLQVKFPENIRSKKLYIVRLYKVAKEDNQVMRLGAGAGRFKLEMKFRGKMIRAMAKGEKAKATRTNAMTKKTKNDKKGVSKMNKAKMSKTVKGK